MFSIYESLLIQNKYGSYKPPSPEKKYQDGGEEYHVTVLWEPQIYYTMREGKGFRVISSH